MRRNLAAHYGRILLGLVAAWIAQTTVFVVILAAFVLIVAGRSSLSGMIDFALGALPVTALGVVVFIIPCSLVLCRLKVSPATGPWIIAGVYAASGLAYAVYIYIDARQRGPLGADAYAVTAAAPLVTALMGFVSGWIFLNILYPKRARREADSSVFT